MARELVQELGGRRDRIARQYQPQPAPGARRDQPERQRGRAVDVAIRARRDIRRRLDPVLDVEQLGRLAERPAGVEGRQVREQDRWLIRELVLDPPLGPVGRTPVQPRQHPQREQVLGAPCVTGRGVLDPLDGAHGERGHRDPMHPERTQRTVLERIGAVAGLLEVALAERVLVDYQRRAAVDLGEVRLERGRVHRNQHVRLVTGGQDVARGEVDLERRDAGERAGRRADLGREAWQRRQVVAQHRGGIREPAARQLHPVSGVSREANNYSFALLNRLNHLVRPMSTAYPYYARGGTKFRTAPPNGWLRLFMGR